MKNTRWLVSLAVTVILTAVVSFSVGFNSRPADHYFEVAKNIDIFGKVMREVNTNYVDEVEPNKFVRFGIDAMLKTLDPYTDYISASEIEDIRFMSTGQYGGIGARVGAREKMIVVTEPYPDSPALKAGLMAGDEIIQIDNEKLEGKNMEPDAVSNMLRGQPKTRVKLIVKRYGVPAPIPFDIEREDIKVKNVEYYSLLEGNIGYVALTGFTKDAHLEVKQAIEKMKQQSGGLKGIIIDLRGNPGGLLFEAIGISNLFIPQGERVVETRGRMEGQNRAFFAESVPLDTETPVAVLVNGGSASASEIVAGVMQDLDRSVVVGRKSYGKGLVQTTRPLSYQSQIKITTARYYTPSGRCIQAIDYKHDDETGGVVKRADSLKQAYKTRAGRTVLDAGGIDPDVKVPETEYHKVAFDLRTQYHMFDFATQYRHKHPTLAAAKEFKVDDALYAEFVRFTQERQFHFSTRAETQVATLKDQLKKEGYLTQLGAQVDVLSAELKKQAANDIWTHKAEISRLLAQDIVNRYHGKAGERENSFGYDEDLKAAISLLKDPVRYKGLLQNAEAKPAAVPGANTPAKK